MQSFKDYSAYIIKIHFNIGFFFFFVFNTFFVCMYILAIQHNGQNILTNSLNQKYNFNLNYLNISSRKHTFIAPHNQQYGTYNLFNSKQVSEDFEAVVCYFNFK